MQLLARLMDRVLAKRSRRATIVGATSGDTGGAAIEAFRGSSRVDVVILFPEGRVSDVQRRMMTTPTEENVHAVAVRGTFDDCQALVKGMFNDHAFRDRTVAVGRQLHQLGAHRRPDHLLLHGGRRAGRAAPRASRLRCRPATSATSSRATRQSAWACRSSARHRLERQRHSAAYAGHGRPTRCARSSPPRRRRWTFRSPPISSATCSRPRAATPRSSAPRWEPCGRKAASTWVR